jgi:MFS family permease
MPDITPSPYRSQANGIINLMGGIGTIIASLVGSTLYEINVAFPFWMGSGLVILAALLVFIFIREPKEYEAGDVEPNMFESLRELLRSEEKSAIRILLAIFFWFLAYTGIEAFLTLYATRYVGIPEGDAGRLLGHIGLFFVLFAFPAGLLGSRIGRRVTISAGIIIMALLIFGLFILPADTLAISLTSLPVLGNIRVVSLFLMPAGIAWALININSLPMVVDMTTAARIGTFTGLYYLFSTLSAIVGPNLNGLLVQLSGDRYNTIMLISPLFLVAALILMLGVRRGEAAPG